MPCVEPVVAPVQLVFVAEDLSLVCMLTSAERSPLEPARQCACVQGGATLLLHEFPCKQHADFKSASHRRQHINLLLLDNCEEYTKTYGADGRPLEHATISALQKRVAKCKVAVGHVSDQVVTGKSTRMPSKELWQSSYVEGGQAAADCWKQVGNKRTNIGTFFSLGNPALPRAKEVQDKVPNMRPMSLTQVRAHPSRSDKSYLVCVARRAWRLLLVKLVLLQELVAARCNSSKDVQVLDLSKLPVPADTPAQAVVEAGRKLVQASHQRTPQPWLMPHQVGDRKMGRKFAKAVNSSRSPIGHFAIFDLPPKF